MAGSHLLVIDDDPLVLKLAKLVFGRARYETRLFDTREALRDEDVTWGDLAIVDMHLEGAHGTDVVAELRHLKPALLVLGWSADDSSPDFIKWQDACDRFVLKPFEVKELLRLVAEMLER